MADIKFRFNAETHTYIHLATGEELPYITQMLDRAGLVNDLWFTEESSARGHCVHALTADYDLGAITDPASVVSIHKGYLDAHIAAMKILQPEILAVEMPLVHPVYLYGGRPDRVVRFRGVLGVWEIKSAVPAKSHPIQTALQAILVASQTDLRPEMLCRWCLYLKPNGKFKFEEHKNLSDFAEARRIIRMVCGVGRAA